MADPLGISPEGLRSAGGHLTDVSGRVKQVLTTLNAKLDGEGQAWGNDKIGDSFAKGPDGYLSQLDWVNSSVGAKTKLLDDYSNTMHDTANTIESQDEHH